MQLVSWGLRWAPSSGGKHHAAHATCVPWAFTKRVASFSGGVCSRHNVLRFKNSLGCLHSLEILHLLMDIFFGFHYLTASFFMGVFILLMGPNLLTEFMPFLGLFFGRAWFSLQLLFTRKTFLTVQ
jgi:hypothetical protein